MSFYPALDGTTSLILAERSRSRGGLEVYRPQYSMCRNGGVKSPVPAKDTELPHEPTYVNLGIWIDDEAYLKYEHRWVGVPG